jgi:hypothetical protein
MTISREKLTAYFLVKSVNEKVIILDYYQISEEMKCKVMDIRLMVNYLHKIGELKYWEKDGVEYVNLFG